MSAAHTSSPTAEQDGGLLPHAQLLREAVQLWSVVYVSSWLIGAGLSPAVRGAFVGAARIIRWLDLVSGSFSQLTALASLYLLVVLAIRSVQPSKNISLGVATALCGSIPAAVVFHASRGELPAAVAIFSAFFASLTAISCAFQRGLKAKDALILGAAGAHHLLLCLALTWGAEGPSQVARLLALLSQLVGWGALLFVGFSYAAEQHRRPWRTAGLLGLTILLSKAAGAEHSIDPPVWLVVLARSINRLSAFGPNSGAALVGISFSLLLYVFTVTARRAALATVIQTLLVLCCFSALTPACSAALTVCAFSTLVFADRSKTS